VTKRIAGVAVLLGVLSQAIVGHGATGEQTADVDVKAAFLLNFAKFTDWPEIAYSDPLVLCVLDDARLAGSLFAIARGQFIDRHRIDVRAVNSTDIQPCHLLFISSRTREVATALQRVKGLPVLTVSDTPRFDGSGGIIEFFIDQYRMRFAIDVDAARRSHLNLSSRLLGLARIVHDDHVQ